MSATEPAVEDGTCALDAVLLWKGRLVPLRTKDEVRAGLETFSAYVVEIPARFANAVKEFVPAYELTLPSANQPV